MKISQMTTEQAADVLIRIAEPVANIMHDEDSIKVLENLANGNDKPLAFIADNLPVVVSVLVKAHRADVYEIVGALSGKPADEIASQKFTQTILDIRDCADKELVDFFGSFRQ